MTHWDVLVKQFSLPLSLCVYSAGLVLPLLWDKNSVRCCNFSAQSQALESPTTTLRMQARSPFGAYNSNGLVPGPGGSTKDPGASTAIRQPASFVGLAGTCYQPLGMVHLHFSENPHPQCLDSLLLVVLENGKSSFNLELCFHLNNLLVASSS